MQDYEEISTKPGVRKQIKSKDVVTWTVVAIATLLTIYPLFIMIMVSLKSTKEALISPNTIPTEVHWENYLLAIQNMDLPRVLLNTVILTGASVAGVIVISGLASYPIALSKHTKLYNFIYYLFLCGIMIPFYTTLVPLVELMNGLNLTDSIPGMIIYYLGRRIPMDVFLYVGFVRGMSYEIIEAAEIDGANIWQTYWKILFPVMKPITTTIMLLDSMGIWNNFLMPRLMLTSKANRVIALAQYYFRSENNNKWELTFAAYVITLLPIVIFYFVFQKNIIKGVGAGAVKG